MQVTHAIVSKTEENLGLFKNLNKHNFQVPPTERQEGLLSPTHTSLTKC